MSTRLPPGLRYMVASAAAFSVMSLLVKVAGRTLPTMEIVLVRAVVTLLLSLAALAIGRVDPWGRERRFLVLRGVFGFAALTCFYWAIVHIPLAEATVIQYTSPVFTALGAALFLSEGLRAVEMVLAGISLVGVTLVARPGFLFGGSAAALPPLDVAVALAGAVFSASAYVVVRRASRSNHALVIVFWFSLVATVASVPLALPEWRAPTGVEWLVLVGVGIATQAGQVFLTRGLERERAGRALTVGYLQIVFAAGWGALVFGEYPGPWTWAGTLLIVGSTFLLARTGEEGGKREAA